MAGLSIYPTVAVLRADDLDRATKFYTDVLGYAVDTDRSGNGVVTLSAGMGSQFTLYERPGMPAPANTTLGIPVPSYDFDSVVVDLRTRGVVFEDYDIPEMDLKTVNGIAEMGGIKTAWFKDTEGNILNIVAM
jgi:catechol 2,3-dioxygenase-like lactoylglutathione lyase family enzyme